MFLLFLALVNDMRAKKEKTRPDEHAIIYVLKIEEMSVENNNSKTVQMSSSWLSQLRRRQLASFLNKIPDAKRAGFFIKERAGMYLLLGLKTKLEVASVDI